MTLLICVRQVYMTAYFTDRGLPDRSAWLAALTVSWAFRLALLPALCEENRLVEARFPHCFRRRVPVGRLHATATLQPLFTLVMASDFLDAQSLQALVRTAHRGPRALRAALNTQGFTRCLSRSC